MANSDNSGFDFGDLFRSFTQKTAPDDPKPKVNWIELIARGTSHVRVAGKVYRVVVTEYEQRKNAT